MCRDCWHRTPRLLPTELLETLPSVKRTLRMTTDSQLQYQLHISEPIPFSRPETAPNGERQMFQYIATTLISGAHDAVLVDPPMTTEQTAQVINWVEASGKTLKHIFITHGHGDHWFGTGPLLKRFPDVTVFAAPGTIEVMHYHASPEVRARSEERRVGKEGHTGWQQ